MNDFPSLWTRRCFLTAAIASLVPGRMAAATQTASPAAAVFQHRGYYLCFMRMPTFGLKVWREILDAVAEDGGNTVVVWMAGAFRSRKYSITCQWHQCGSRYFDHEFAFVREISNEVWNRRPEATVVVYPHYFSGARLRFAFAEATAAKQPFDPRWTLFFTPHSAALEPDLIARAKSAWWWNEAPAASASPTFRPAQEMARRPMASGYPAPARGVDHRAGRQSSFSAAARRPVAFAISRNRSASATPFFAGCRTACRITHLRSSDAPRAQRSHNSNASLGWSLAISPR